MKTLLLNPPSFPNFDGGASSRWPATREITSFWYPVWLTYPAGLIQKSRLLDAPPHGITPEETVRISKDYDFAVIFTSTPGFKNEIRLAEMMKSAKADIKIALVGPPVTVKPEESLKASSAVDFVARKEFDYSVAEFAWGRKLEEINGISFRKNGHIVHTPDRPQLNDLDALPFAVDIYKRDLDVTRYNVPFLLHPYIAFYTGRGCPALCTFCLWPQTVGGHKYRAKSPEAVAREMAHAKQLFPKVKEFFFDDDTFTALAPRAREIAKRLGNLGITWSCNARA